MAGDLLQRIHSNLSTGSGDWADVRTEVTGAYASQNGSGVNYVYFSNHVIREFNDKITDLNLPTGLYLSPFDAGSRYTGTGNFSNFPA